MKRFIAALLLRNRARSKIQNRKSKITIEPNPHHITAVFERSRLNGSYFTNTNHEHAHVSWSWPRSTWMQRRLEAIRK